MILLLTNGADVRARNSKGDTPLHKACSNPVMKLIILELKDADRKGIYASGEVGGDTILEVCLELSMV